MKKTLLMAGVASVLTFTSAFDANAGYMHDILKESRAYIGADYVYSRVKFGSPATHMKKNFNSGMVNIGAEMYDYYGWELFYQQSRKGKKTHDGEKHSAKFLAYGMDVYGYAPIMCSPLNLVGTLGFANYRFDMTYPDVSSKKQNRIGYRAGAGLQYNLTDHVSMRVIGRYSYVGMKRVNNLKEITAGLRYTF